MDEAADGVMREVAESKAMPCRCSRRARQRRRPPCRRSGGSLRAAQTVHGSGPRCWRCARSSQGGCYPGDRHGPRPRARSPNSTAEWVRRARSRAMAEVSCFHRRRHVGQAPDHRPMSLPLGAARLSQKGSSKPADTRHSITARSTVRSCLTAVSPRAPKPKKVVRSGQEKVVAGTLKSSSWGV